MTESEIAAEFDRQHAALGHMWGYDTAKGREQSAEATFARCHAITGHGPAVPNRIAELEAQLAAMTAERDHALLRMEVAIATSHGLIDAEVQRRVAKNVAAIFERAPRAFPANALCHQRQPGGLLSTADSGRVRLGGYAPSLPPR